MVYQCLLTVKASALCLCSSKKNCVSSCQSKDLTATVHACVNSVRIPLASGYKIPVGDAQTRSNVMIPWKDKDEW